MSVGQLSAAEVPTPFVLPNDPLPAREVSAPDGAMRSTRLLPHAPTYTFPNASTGTPWGPVSIAKVPTPLKKEAVPFPASVVTSPDGEMRRTRLPEKSPTSTLCDTGSTDTPWGALNTAAAPWPSAHPSAPLPASVVTFQAQGGCAVKPATEHAVAGEQGTHAAAPPAKVPTGHVVALNAQDVAPWGLKAPAAQEAHAPAEGAPVDSENVPAAQGMQAEGAAAPTAALNLPAPQRTHAVTLEAPVAFDHVPAGQGRGAPEPAGQ